METSKTIYRFFYKNVLRFSMALAIHFILADIFSCNGISRGVGGLTLFTS